MKSSLPCNCQGADFHFRWTGWKGTVNQLVEKLKDAEKSKNNRGTESETEDQKWNLPMVVKIIRGYDGGEIADWEQKGLIAGRVLVVTSMTYQERIRMVTNDDQEVTMPTNSLMKFQILSDGLQVGGHRGDEKCRPVALREMRSMNLLTANQIIQISPDADMPQLPNAPKNLYSPLTVLEIFKEYFLICVPNKPPKLRYQPNPSDFILIPAYYPIMMASAEDCFLDANDNLFENCELALRDYMKSNSMGNYDGNSLFDMEEITLSPRKKDEYEFIMTTQQQHQQHLQHLQQQQHHKPQQYLQQQHLQHNQPQQQNQQLQHPELQQPNFGHRYLQHQQLASLSPSPSSSSSSSMFSPPLSSFSQSEPPAPETEVNDVNRTGTKKRLSLVRREAFHRGMNNNIQEDNNINHNDDNKSSGNTGSDTNINITQKQERRQERPSPAKRPLPPLPRPVALHPLLPTPPSSSLSTLSSVSASASNTMSSTKTSRSTSSLMNAKKNVKNNAKNNTNSTDYINNNRNNTRTDVLKQESGFMDNGSSQLNKQLQQKMFNSAFNTKLKSAKSLTHLNTNDAKQQSQQDFQQLQPEPPTNFTSLNKKTWKKHKTRLSTPTMLKSNNLVSNNSNNVLNLSLPVDVNNDGDHIISENNRSRTDDNGNNANSKNQSFNYRNPKNLTTTAFKDITVSSNNENISINNNNNNNNNSTIDKRTNTSSFNFASTLPKVLKALKNSLTGSTSNYGSSDNSGNAKKSSWTYMPGDISEDCEAKRQPTDLDVEVPMLDEPRRLLSKNQVDNVGNSTVESSTRDNYDEIGSPLIVKYHIPLQEYDERTKWNVIANNSNSCNPNLADGHNFTNKNNFNNIDEPKLRRLSKSLDDLEKDNVDSCDTNEDCFHQDENSSSWDAATTRLFNKRLYQRQLVREEYFDTESKQHSEDSMYYEIIDSTSHNEIFKRSNNDGAYMDTSDKTVTDVSNENILTNCGNINNNSANSTAYNKSLDDETASYNSSVFGGGSCSYGYDNTPFTAVTFSKNKITNATIDTTTATAATDVNVTSSENYNDTYVLNARYEEIYELDDVVSVSTASSMSANDDSSSNYLDMSKPQKKLNKMIDKFDNNNNVIPISSSNNSSSNFEDNWTSLDQIPLDTTSFSVQEVSKCLKLLNMDKHVDSFIKEQVDGSLLYCLDVDVLVADFNFKKFDAIKLIRFFKDGWRPKLSVV